MDHVARHPVLRLVGEGRPAAAAAPSARAGPAERAPVAGLEHPSLSVARENQRAAALTREDVRWVFAVRVAHALDGGRAAILPPEKRRALVAEAVGAGLRAFDANLVIAIVQDAARSGRHPANPDVYSRLAMVPARADEADSPRRSMRLLLAAGLAGAMLAGLIRWILG